MYLSGCIRCCRKSILRNLICRKSIQVANVYKGLQKPLIFKGFKGKFIYIGGACIISALLFMCYCFYSGFFMWGGITLVIVMFGGLGITSQLQRKGLHRKDKRKGIYIVSRTFIRDRKNKAYEKKSEFRLLILVLKQ